MTRPGLSARSSTPLGQTGVILVLLTGCERTQQSALHAAGPQAAHIEQLWWLFFWTLTAVFVVVMAVTAVATLRRRRHSVRGPEVDGLPENPPPGLRPLETDPGQERRLWHAVAGSTALTFLILVVLLVTSFTTGRALAELHQARPAVTVVVVGHQWWWELVYGDPARPSERFSTANELHVPVGEPVKLVLESRDVIHSFWVPELAGKLDLIPGRKNELVIQADAPGTYRGQCAEFCGVQHANMGLRVIAESRDDFLAWRLAQQRPVEPPSTRQAQRGLELFLSRPCVMCHAIQGTDARAGNGPDLTHLMSRQTLGAGTLPLTRGYLAGWILNAQSLKPGSHMPSISLEADELEALLSFLEGLR